MWSSSWTTCNALVLILSTTSYHTLAFTRRLAITRAFLPTLIRSNGVIETPHVKGSIDRPFTTVTTTATMMTKALRGGDGRAGHLAHRTMQRIFRLAATTSDSTSSSTSTDSDTPIILPNFANKEEYLQYMETVSPLPKGFACGTASGTFVSEEGTCFVSCLFSPSWVYFCRSHSPSSSVSHLSLSLSLLLMI